MKYKNYDVYMAYDRYTSTNNLAISLFEKDTNELVTVCTVNVEPLGFGEVSIKDYSENEGMLDWLISNNIVEPPHNHIASGWVMIPVCKLKTVPTYE